MEISIGSDSLYVSTSTIVKLNEYLTLITEDGNVDIKVDISADFKDIPLKYHEVILNMLTSKYVNKVSYGHNPFSQCKPPQTKKWYQFWKKNK